MTVADLATSVDATPVRTTKRRLGIVRRRGVDAVPYLSVGVLTVFIVAGAIGPLVAPHDPNMLNMGEALKPPVWSKDGSWTYVLGTDDLGRDVFSRLLSGARISLLVALAAVLFSGLVGVSLALIAGYRGGRVDSAITRVADASVAFPILLLAIVIVGTFGPSMTAVIVILAIAGWSQYCRVVRSEVLSIATLDFVTMSKVMGAKSRWVIIHHILPNVVSTVLVLATLQMGLAIIAEGSLSFLGIGVPAPAVSWGGMLSDGRKFMTTAWWLSVVPGVALSGVVLSANVVGDWLRVRNDPARRS